MTIYQLSKGYNIGRFTVAMWKYWNERMFEEFGIDFALINFEDKEYIHLKNIKHWSGYETQTNL